MNLVLGSSSIFRKAQMDQLGLAYQTYSPDIDEDTIKTSGLSPKEISKELSLKKAQAVLAKFPDSIVIGADQVLSFKGEIFSKPMTKQKAIEQLLKLSGATHELITSYAIITKDKQVVETVTSKMTMRELSQTQIESYVDKDNPLHSCGAYKLETIGIALFEQIQCPDHSAIIGLPLISLTTKLKEFGIEVL